MENIRFIEIQAADLYYASHYEKKIEVKNKKDEFDYRYRDIVPPNLDLLFLESEGKLRKKPLGDEFYSEVLINVLFDYPLYISKKGLQVLPKSKYETVVPIREIRRDLYLNGFELNSKKYVRYKRSSGSAKGGSCLFIRDNLYSMMNKWSKAGLDEKTDLCLHDLTSYEAYKALSLSSLIAELDLDPHNILFVKDAEVVLKKQNVIKVFYDKEKGLDAEEAVCDIKNNIFDGEGLLDASVFKKAGRAKKGMMLLRSRFFKCCAFNTNLKKWFADNCITQISQLNGITFAKSVDDIVLVASESCLKYLKMCKGGFCEENIKRWCDEINKTTPHFGVVKTDKPTRFFNGEMVETTYQLLNSLQLKEKKIAAFVNKYFEYIMLVRDIKRTPEFIRFYLEGEDTGNQYDDYNDDSEDNNELNAAKEMLSYSSYSFKNKMCLELVKIDGRVKYTDLFKNRVFSSIIDSLMLKLYNGRVLVNGTYATLFGNPFEYLNYIIRDNDNNVCFDVNNPKSIFKENEISCSFFEDGKKLVGSRAPHITMGNVLLVENKRFDQIDRYFNLTKQIVVVDAINNNIQQRLSGCDYDSDTMLLTDNEYLVEAATRNYKLFPVPYTCFDSSKKKMKEFKGVPKNENMLLNLYTIDNEIADNIVGKIVNLSQLLNSHLWNSFENGKNKDFKELYKKIAVLSVLSGAEIDSAKRSFPFKTRTEYNRLLKYAKEKQYTETYPMFFTILRKEHGHKPKISKIKQQNNKERVFKTSMDYLWDVVNKTGFDSDIRTETIPFFDLLSEGFATSGIAGDTYRQVNEAVDVLDRVKESVAQIRDESDSNDFELKKMNFNNEIRKAYKELKHKINTPEKTKLILKALEKKDDGYSKSFIFLYLISSFSNQLSYTLKSLFANEAEPMPSLRKARSNEKPQYTLFGKYHYVISK